MPTNKKNHSQVKSTVSLTLNRLSNHKFLAATAAVATHFPPGFAHFHSAKNLQCNEMQPFFWKKPTPQPPGV